MKNILLFAVAIIGIAAVCQSFKINNNMEKTQSKVTVWDTYVTKKDGNIMHFDIVAPVEVVDTAIIHGYGKEYLKTKEQGGQTLTAKQCRRCHIATLRPEWEEDKMRILMSF